MLSSFNTSKILKILEDHLVINSYIYRIISGFFWMIVKLDISIFCNILILNEGTLYFRKLQI